MSDVGGVTLEGYDSHRQTFKCNAEGKECKPDIKRFTIDSAVVVGQTMRWNANFAKKLFHDGKSQIVLQVRSVDSSVFPAFIFEAPNISRYSVALGEYMFEPAPLDNIFLREYSRSTVSVRDYGFIFASVVYVDYDGNVPVSAPQAKVETTPAK